jgi:hypothetical protein
VVVGFTGGLCLPLEIYLTNIFQDGLRVFFANNNSLGQSEHFSSSNTCMFTPTNPFCYRKGLFFF